MPTQVPSAVAVVATGPNVEYIEPSLSAKLTTYDKIRDCLLGSEAIKKAREKYLPMPNAHDRSPENVARYDAYIARAVFYAVAKRTLAGLVGQVFLTDPICEVPELIDAVVKDANGNGVPLFQLAKRTEEFVLSFGRAGLLADFPATEGRATTRKEQLDGSIRPTINLYAPEDVINWRTKVRGSDTVLSLVVLSERYASHDDGFETKYEQQFRVLRLTNDDIYQVEIWRGANGSWSIHTTANPTDSKGAPLKDIPFTFVGAVTNDASVDEPPLLDICELNIAHYRNSADYEEGAYMAGQPTFILTGLTEDWVKTVLGGRVEMGARAAVALPVGASGELLSMEANSVPFEAMEHKERQMVALGAKLVEQKTVQRTAKEATQDNASEASVLTTITQNVSSAVKFMLEWCAIFAGATTLSADAVDSEDDPAIDFQLNTDFDATLITTEEIRATLEAWEKDAITFTEMREQLRKAGKATLDDEAAMKEIREDQMRRIADNKAMGFDPFADQNGNNPGGDGGA